MARKTYNPKHRGGRKPRRPADAVDTKTERAEKGTNDESWYSKFPQLTADTGSLFFSNPLGGYVPRIGELFDSSARYSAEPALYSAPGILVLKTLSGPGSSRDASSPVNAIARGIYSFIRSQNSGSKNYDPSDFMLYLLGMDALYTIWAKCVRAYGVARYFNPKSRYLAKEFLTALGFNAADILGNLAQFRYTINQFAVKLSSYLVPATMDYFKRHTQIFLNIYQDSDDLKAQDYVLDPAGYYLYSETSEDGGKLVWNDYPANMTLADISNILNSSIQPIINSEDFNIMSGDVLKAYGADKVFAIPMVNEDYVTAFVKDDVMLSQIENAMILNTVDITSLGVTQDPTTASIVFAPVLADSQDIFPRKLLNLHWQNPTSGDVMEATRFMFNIGHDDVLGYYVSSCGADLILAAYMYVYTGGQTMEPIRYRGTEYFDVDTDIGVISSKIAEFGQATAFHRAPRQTLWTYDPQNQLIHLIYDRFDLDNYTILPDQVLENLNNVAMLSLFDVDHIGLIR